MSTFLGLIEEIPGISVDRFDGGNLCSSAYFLSHYHTDHMHGLDKDFFQRLERLNKYLYCSSITKVFLSDIYSGIHHNVKELDIDKAVPVEYRNENGDIDVLFVTCISAGHCLGSVMFLFEKADKLILYTGDFRINSIDLPNIKSLHHHSGSVSSPKKLTKVYLDTTFLNPDFATFPTRKECRHKMYEVIENWLMKDPTRHVVVLECSALYGPEYLFIELSKHFKKPIHVKDRVYSNYCRIPDLKPHVTNDRHATSIHACMDKLERSGLKCRPDVPQQDIFTIIPSTCKWKGKDTSIIGNYDDDKKKIYNLCYSMHCSLKELEAFIQYFNPKDIFPCVCRSKESEQDIYKLLKKIMKK